jgi:uncharacterized membrane protein YeaQ/YmgE (transglycosylase-associated protein family)
MGILTWIIFGALAGWLTSLFTGTRKRRGCIGNIILGIVGAFVGGMLMEFLTGSEMNFGFDLRSFVVAMIGAILVLVLFGGMKKRR